MAKPVNDSKAKYKNNINQTAYEKGVDAVTASPTAAAVAQKESFEKNTVAGKENLVKNLSKITLSDWQTATKKGFDKLEEKVTKAVDSGKWDAGKVINAGKAAKAAVAGMKKGTYSDSYERYLAAKNAIINYYKSK